MNVNHVITDKYTGVLKTVDVEAPQKYFFNKKSLSILPLFLKNNNAIRISYNLLFRIWIFYFSKITHKQFWNKICHLKFKWHFCCYYDCRQVVYVRIKSVVRTRYISLLLSSSINGRLLELKQQNCKYMFYLMEQYFCATFKCFTKLNCDKMSYVNY